MDSERLFAKTVDRLKAAVCPECGEVSLYIENMDKLKADR